MYLDTEERRRFAQKGHEYLIEQVQHTGGDTIFNGSSSGTNAETNIQLVRLSFNHPVKEFIWCYTNPNVVPGASLAAPGANLNAMWNFTSTTGNVNVTCNVASMAISNNWQIPHHAGRPLILNGAGTVTATQTQQFGGNCYWIEDGNLSAGTTEVGPLHLFKVVLNGQDRFKEQAGKYFNSVQPYLYHTGTPYPGIYAYSFALQPEEHQPTGTCNFSRIDNAQVSVQLKSNCQTPLQKLFAVNYNILRIQSGMGGLAFSN